MSRSHVPTFTHRGRADIVSQVIAGGSTWLHSITIPRDDFTHGFVLLGVPYAGTTAERQRSTANVYITTAEADAASQAMFRTATGFTNSYGCGQIFYNWSHRAYFHSADSKLSDGYLETSGGQIRLTSAVINGAQIDLLFENTHASFPGTLNLDVTYRVEKIER